MARDESQWYETSFIHDTLQQEFYMRWMLALGPVEAAIFAVPGDRFQGVRCYVAPAMAALAPDLLLKCEATPCCKPDMDNISLIVGDQRVIDEDCL